MRLIIFAIAFSQKALYHFDYLCVQSLDYNDLTPGVNKPSKARGIYFFGNEKKTNKELWFTNEDMRTHVLDFWFNR